MHTDQQHACCEISQACLKRMRSAGTFVFWMSLPSGPIFQYCVCTQCILTCLGAPRTGAAVSAHEHWRGEHMSTGGASTRAILRNPAAPTPQHTSNQRRSLAAFGTSPSHPSQHCKHPSPPGGGSLSAALSCEPLRTGLWHSASTPGRGGVQGRQTMVSSSACVRPGAAGALSFRTSRQTHAQCPGHSGSGRCICRPAQQMRVPTCAAPEHFSTPVQNKKNIQCKNGQPTCAATEYSSTSGSLVRWICSGRVVGRVGGWVQ